MRLTIGETPVNSPSLAMIEDAYVYANGQSNSSHNWAWGGWYGWYGSFSSPLHFARLTVPSSSYHYYDDATLSGPAPWLQSSVLVDAVTAGKLDREFAAGDPLVILEDREHKIRAGLAVFLARTLLKDHTDPALRVWSYSFVLRPEKKWRTSIQRQHAWTWQDVMEECYPPVGKPITTGPTLLNPAADLLYDYLSHYSLYYVGQRFYFQTISLDSGCRFAQSMDQLTRDVGHQFVKARFWTLSEAKQLADSEWNRYSGRILFGGRMTSAELRGEMPRVFKVTYQTTGSTTSTTQEYPTGREFGVGTELLALANVRAVSALDTQMAEFQRWEEESRRNTQTVFSGLVPWKMTPLDWYVQWCLPIDGQQEPSTIVHGGGITWRAHEPLPTSNPAKTPNKITVTFTRPATGTGSTQAIAGRLKRENVEGGEGPLFAGEMVFLSNSVTKTYDNLPDGTYSASPGAPWHPTSVTLNLVGGQTGTMSFVTPPP